MSFFDEDPPTRQARQARPRRPEGAGAASGTPDPQTVRVRQAGLVGGVVVLFILLVFGINGCLNSRQETQLKNYNREVAAIAQSSAQVSEQLFTALNGGASGEDLQVDVNQIRLVAEEDVNRARNLDAPDEMAPAQRNLELALNLRFGAVEKIGAALRSTTSDEPETARDAVQRIAGQMQAVLASDVVYSQRVQPLISQALADEGIGGQTIQPSRFLQSLAWLQPETIADRLGSEAAQAGQTQSGDREPAPGLHGHGLTSVTVGSTALQPGSAVNRIPAGADIEFDVAFQNQGENDEQAVTVTVLLTPSSGRPTTKRERVPLTRSKQAATAAVALGADPPTGTPVTIKVTVERVPGEENVENNTQTYTVLFTR